MRRIRIRYFTLINVTSAFLPNEGYTACETDEVKPAWFVHVIVCRRLMGISWATFWIRREAGGAFFISAVWNMHP